MKRYLIGVILCLVASHIHALTYYVDAARANDNGAGTSWATAKKTIQAAVNVSASGDKIIVRNGQYGVVSTANKLITIQSVNGASVSIIDGGGKHCCAKLGGGSNDTNSVLTGFTLRNGYTSSDGGGSYGGTINNCTISGNTALYGGGSYGGTLNNCVISGNTASFGGGSYGGTLNNCVISGNTASFGGGVYGGGTLYNCTLFDNTASYYAGVSGGTLYNCIVWGNQKEDGTTENYSNSTFLYSCTTPLPAGTGNISADPMFVDDIYGGGVLSIGSPCIDKGTNAYVVGTKELGGKARIQNGIVDMGAYEGAVSGYLIKCRVQGYGRIVEPSTVVVSGGGFTFNASELGRAFSHFLTNGIFASSSQTFTWSNIKADGVLTAVFIPGTFYVDASRPNDSGSGESWAAAKKTIQAAVSATILGDLILVQDGVYSSINTENKEITIQSINGATITFIDGGGINRCATLGDSIVQQKTVLVGFTLLNGYTSSDGGGSYGGTINNCTITNNTANWGGGARYGILSNCIVSDNTAGMGGGAAGSTLNSCTISGNMTTGGGGGATGGILNKCTISDNTANFGGGVYDGTLTSCMIMCNAAKYGGGGASDSSLNNCTISDNAANDGGGTFNSTLINCVIGDNRAKDGGGICYGTLDKCIVIDNVADYEGGGVSEGIINNCIIRNNTAGSYGGGIYRGEANNCTIVNNTAIYYDGSGVYGGVLNNCVIWGNHMPNGTTNNYCEATLSYSCTSPMPPGIGNISDDPLFADAERGNFRLSGGSPCIDKGENAYAVGAMDVVGNSRIFDGDHDGVVTVDIGAYEITTLEVTFDPQGGTVEFNDEIVINGMPYGTLPVPIRKGYDFVGWFMNAPFTTKLINETTIVLDVVDHILHAKWMPSLVSIGKTSAVKKLCYEEGGAQLGGSGQLSNGEMAGVEWSMTGSGTLSFDWKVSSELEWDWLNFYEVGFGETNRISGTGGDWTRFSVTVTGETNDIHTFRWEYEKDPFGDYVGEDSGWVAMIDWIPAYTLTINDGNGGGLYTNGAVVIVTANEPHEMFDRWIGDINNMTDTFSANTTFMMPNNAATLTAIYKTNLYSVVVNNGTGGGTYTNGALVGIVADVPLPHYEFDVWTGETNGVDNVYSPITTLKVSGGGRIVTARYKVSSYPVDVNGGQGSGVYTYGSTIDLIATSYEGKRFYRWSGATNNVADVNAPTTTVFIAGETLSLTSLYYTHLTVNAGAGSAWYLEGATAVVAADPEPLYKRFVGWSGDDVDLLVAPANRTTSLVIPMWPVILTAEYRDDISKVAGCYGRSISESGVSGGITADVDAGSPSGTPVVKLGGVMVCGANVIPNNGFAAFETVVSGGGTVTFWWRVSSESGADYLRFFVDDVEVDAISGTKGLWAQIINRVDGAGDFHTLRWEYAKNASLESSADAGWVDDIVWIGDVPVPTIAPNILTAVPEGNALALTFWGERGIPYTVYSNASLSVTGWAPMDVVPYELSETNGLFWFEALITPPIDLPACFYRVFGGN